MADEASNREAFRIQEFYCRNMDAPIYARLCTAIAEGLTRDSRVGARILDWPGEPTRDALPLRFIGGLHALVQAGADSGLAAVFRGETTDQDAIAAAVNAALGVHDDFLLPWLDGPPQTNEAGRSWGFVTAMLWLAERGLPARFDCLEIGSSAGINLMLDRYSYDLGGVKVGPTSGAAIHFAPEWRGPPPPERSIAVASLKGCDVAPIDLTDPAEAAKLKAYVWPEHTVRFQRIDAAIAAAGARKPDLVRMNAADFVEQQLAAPQQPGTTRVLMHSIVWQYVPADQQARIERAMEEHGAKATPERALAWVKLEADRTLLAHGLHVRYWPGGEDERALATAHAHGAWAEWMAS